MSDKYIDVTKSVFFYHYLLLAKMWRNRKGEEQKKIRDDQGMVGMRYGIAVTKHAIFHIA